jgi:hypothetical protein
MEHFTALAVVLLPTFGQDLVQHPAVGDPVGAAIVRVAQLDLLGAVELDPGGCVPAGVAERSRVTVPWAVTLLRFSREFGSRRIRYL